VQLRGGLNLGVPVEDREEAGNLIGPVTMPLTDRQESATNERAIQMMGLAIVTAKSC
jgi:hypothetical protein